MFLPLTSKRPNSISASQIPLFWLLIISPSFFSAWTLSPPDGCLLLLTYSTANWGLFYPSWTSAFGFVDLTSLISLAASPLVTRTHLPPSRHLHTSELLLPQRHPSHKGSFVPVVGGSSGVPSSGEVRGGRRPGSSRLKRKNSIDLFSCPSFFAAPRCEGDRSDLVQRRRGATSIHQHVPGCFLEDDR